MAKFVNATVKDHQETSLTQGGSSAVYTAPAKGAILIGATLANTDANDNDNNYSLVVYDSSAGKFIHIVDGAPVPDGASLVAVDNSQKIVLDDSDEVHIIVAGGTEKVDGFLSLWEEIN